MTPGAPDRDAPPRPAAAAALTGWWLTGLCIAAIAVAAMAAITFDLRTRNAHADNRLLSQTMVRAAVIEEWMARRLTLGNYLTKADGLNEQTSRWLDQRDPEARSRVIAKLGDLREAFEADAVIAMGADGTVLADRPEAELGLGEPARAAVARAIALGRTVVAPVPSFDDPAGAPMLEMAIPLVKTGAPARAALLARYDPRRRLLPLLDQARWAEPPDEPGARYRIVDRAALPAGSAALAERAPHGPGVGLAPDERFKRLTWPVAGTSWALESSLDLTRQQVAAREFATITGALAVFLMLLTLATRHVVLKHGELREAARELRLRHEKAEALSLLDSVATHSVDAIVAKDLDGRYVYCNAAAARVLARRVDEVLGRRDAEFLDADAAQRSAETERTVRGLPAPMLFEEVDEHGDKVWMSARGPLFDGDGQVRGTFAVSRDVTKLKQAEAASREREKYLGSVIATLGEGVLVLDEHGGVIDCNPAARQSIGCSAAWCGRLPLPPGWSLLRDDGTVVAQAERVMTRLLARRVRPSSIVLRVRDPQGTDRWFECRAVPLDHATLLGSKHTVVSFVDITSRRHADAELERHRSALEVQVAERTAQWSRANAALTASERFLRTVTDMVPSNVAYVDTSLRYRFVNRAYAQWCGMAPERMIGRSMRNVLGVEVFAVIEPALRAAFGGKHQPFERQLMSIDRSRVDHQIGAYVPDIDRGVVRGVTVVSTDVTAMKQAALQLADLNDQLEKRVFEAEAATRAKSAFLANMSHEIRTPMNAIIGHTHLLRRLLGEAPHQVHLHRIDNAARHLLTVINSILDLSKIEAGQMQLEVREFSLTEVLIQCLEMVDVKARAKGLALTLDHRRSPERVIGDPTRLSQSIINLLANAVNFTDAGSVHLLAEVGDREDERVRIRFEVKDSGVGIPAHMQDRLFGAFEQVDVSPTRSRGGSGLGLKLTQQLAELMGGEVGVVSEPGVGSRFWFTAWLGRVAGVERASDKILSFHPRSPLDPPGPALEERIRAEHAGCAVLLAEDNPINAEIASALLRAAGLDVDVASHGLEAVTMTKGRRYDLVLMDMQMPVMDGLSATAAIRAEAERTMPIVAMTANAFNDDRSACLAAGMNDHIAKPVDPTQFYETLLRWLPPGRLQPPAVDPRQTVPLVDDAELAAARQRLEAVDGLDLQQGMASVGGELATLLQALAAFSRMYRHGDPALVRRLPQAQAVANWRSTCHSLRGVCRTLGAVGLETEVRAFAALLEQPASLAEASKAASALNQHLMRLARHLSAASPH